MNTKLVAVFIVVLVSTTACDSSTWVDIPGIAGGCKAGKPSGMGMKSAADVKLFAQGMCATRQKNYTGDFQCNGEDLQVKCK